MSVVNVSDVDRYLYCVTFSGKDMRGDQKVRVGGSWIRRDQEGVFWLPHLPQVVLRQLIRMLSYR